MNHQRLQRIMSGRGGPADAIARLGLELASPVYGVAVSGRNRLFDAGVRGSVALGRPTISVGNLTTGGTGKTPMVLHLVRRLTRMGATPAVLTRGYHGGDEARQMQAELGPGVPVEANPDRAAGAEAVLIAHPQTSVFILDDGFQHRQVRRDLDLVLIDATNPFGFDHLLPRGLLREPAANLRRADAVIVTRAEQVSAETLAQVDQRIAELTGQPPMAHASMRWSALRCGDIELPVEALRTRRVVGICGIGNPAAFERALRQLARQVAAMHTFADHHHYSGDDRAHLQRAADDADAALVMTEKDWVKWSALEPDGDDGRGAASRPVFRPVLSIDLTPGGDRLDALLRDRLHLSDQQEQP